MPSKCCQGGYFKVYMIRMAQRIYPMRLSVRDHRLFYRAAKAEKKTMAEFLRVAGRERATQKVRKRWACLDYPERDLSPKAENEKDFVRRKFAGKP
jgi:hypothetical protein